MGKHMLTVYVGVLALIPAISRFLDTSIVHVIENAEEKTRFVVSMDVIINSFIYLVLIMVIVWIIAALIRIFAKPMAANSSMNACLKTVAYAFTPILLSFIFGWIPFIGVFFALYAIILLIWAINHILRPKKMAFWFYLMSIMFFVFLQMVLEYIMTFV